MELTVEYIPALIIAKDKDGKYIKISEANNETEYYCPICNGIIKPRAIGSEKVQPHFYHVSETNCNNESILHWMFKNWLFEKGTEFKIDNEIFIVQDFEMEKKYETPYGDYIPDLIINTDKETFFFEINYSNSKDKTYSDKWMYLKNRVVEVNVKELINCELYETIPTFKIIFENGEYKKEYKQYEKKDKYVEFKKYIVDSKKEDEVKYIAEKFDWFWKNIKNENNEDIKLCINSMEYDDAVSCCKFLKKVKCHDKFEICKNETSVRFEELLNDKIKEYGFTVKLNKVSKQIYNILIHGNVKNKSIKEIISLRTYDGLLYFKNNENEIINKCMNLINRINTINKLIEDIKNLRIENHKVECVYDFDDILYDDSIDLVVNLYIEEDDKWMRVFGETIKSIDRVKEKINKHIQNLLTNEKIKKEIMSKNFENIINSKLKNNITIKTYISNEDTCYSHMGYELIYENKVITKEEEHIDCLYETNIFDIDEIIKKSNTIVEMIQKINPFVLKINNCKNKLWSCDYTFSTYDEVKIYITNTELNEYISPLYLSETELNDIENLTHEHLQYELKNIEIRKEKRLVIVKENSNEN